MALSGGIRGSYCVFVVADHRTISLCISHLLFSKSRATDLAAAPPRSWWPVVSVTANVVGPYFDAADAKERAIVRIAYWDRFLAAAAVLVAGAAVVALVAPRLCGFADNRPL